MFKWLFAAFILVPCIELILLFTIGTAMGMAVTIGIILLTGFVGAALARCQGADAIYRIQQATNQGRMPADELLDGMLIFAAGLLLVTPGFLTDTVGFSLLAPPLRRWVRKGVARMLQHSMKKHFVVHTEVHRKTTDQFADRESTHRTDEVIDVKAEVVDRENP
jgi:UPF0716 protein FxsA